MIEAGTLVRVHYELRLDGADVIESTFDGDPEAVVLGRGEFPAYLERRIAELHPGQECELAVPAGAAVFGARDPAAVQRLDAKLFDPRQRTPGSLVEFETPAGDWARGRVESIEDDIVVVDFNNPLVGRDVHCRIRLVEVVSAESRT